jgi:hypothetical protein
MSRSIRRDLAVPLEIQKISKLYFPEGVSMVDTTGVCHFYTRKGEETVDLEMVGKWAFIVGLVLAVIAGLLFSAAWMVWVLVLLGVIVGLLNVTGAETQGFLIAAIAFTLAATALSAIPFVGGMLTSILSYVGAFVSGAMVVVALKSLFASART